MRILVLGANGFVGSAIVKVLSRDHEIIKSSKEANDSEDLHGVDLLNKKSIQKLLIDNKPNIIINAAGIVENSEKAQLNVEFTKNLLEVISENQLDVEKIIICGSAAEYGFVEAHELPVKETTKLRANSLYGESKKQETSLALSFAKKHSMRVVVARIFNPIGVGMHSRFLIPNIIKQVQESAHNPKKVIEVSRKDSRRDYINVTDVALALKLLIENDLKDDIYNIGSGVSTSNNELIELVINKLGVKTKPSIIETSLEPESLVAIQADISRIKNEIGWEPKYNIEDTVEEIIKTGV